MKRKSLILLTFALLSGVLAGCSNGQHQHTFSDVWSYDENQHWHAATCEHKDLKSDIGNHVDKDNNGKCDVCFYDMSVAPAKVTITVVNGTGGGQYDVGSSVTVTAIVDAGCIFKEWTVDDVKVSEENPYTFIAQKDLTITAIQTIDSPMAQYTRTLTMTGDTFKVLNLTDTQLHDGDNFEAFADIVDTLVDREKPDMITLLGDIINDDLTYGVTVNAAKTVSLLDSYNIPWAPIFGNHDNLEYKVSGSKKTGGVPMLMDLFSECKNCLFIAGPDEVQGKSNYMVNIVDSKGKMVESFVFLDSFTNGLQDSNVAFYEDCITYAKQLNNGINVPSVMFTHIPLPEYSDACNAALDEECHNLVGTIGNNTLPAGTDKMFKKVKNLGSTTTVICGHDHDAALITKYDGINLCYAMKSSLGDSKANDNNIYSVAKGGLVLEVGNGEDKLDFTRYENITYELKYNDKVFKELTYKPGCLSYWKYRAAKLCFDVEFPDVSGHFNLNIQGTNMQRSNVPERERKGEWNRLTKNVSIGSDIAGGATYGTMEEIVENKLYHFSADLSGWALNTGSGEKACGDETAKLVYISGVTAGTFKLTNIRWVLEEYPIDKQADLANASIAAMSDVEIFGLPVKPEPVVTLNGKTLVKGDDIIYTYSNNDAVGTGTVTIIPSGKGAKNYKGSVSATFNIVKGVSYRGEAFVGKEGYAKVLSPIPLSHDLHLDILFTTDNTKVIKLFLGDGWSNYFGWFTLSPTSKTGDTGLDHVTVSDSPEGDGYKRFTFDLDALDKKGKDINEINLVHMKGDGEDWSTANGYIDIIED